MSLEKTIRIGQLFTLYKDLLTPRQKEMLALFYNEDLSLSEIAEQYDISRQGVHDSIRRGEQALENYESFLQLEQRRTRRLEIYQQLGDRLDDEQSLKLLKQLVSFDE